MTSRPTFSFSVKTVFHRVSWKTGISVAQFKLIYVLSISYPIPSLAPDVCERNHLYQVSEKETVVCNATCIQ